MRRNTYIEPIKRKDFLNDIKLLVLGLVTSKSETISTAQGVSASDYEYVGFSQKARKPMKIESVLTGEEIEVYSKKQVHSMKLHMALKRAENLKTAIAPTSP